MSGTATVEVLTAEVRVLMVGSRQVTLSVARQLDEIDPDGFTPFGRITTGRKDEPHVSAVEVIGRAEDGTLARSVATAERLICRGYDTGEDGRYLACAEHRAASGQQHHWTWCYPDPETFAAWANLPLVVLAGLR
jgi:hypothetical protein